MALGFLSAERLIASHLRLAAAALEAAETLWRIRNRNAAYEAEQALEHLALALAQSESVHVGRAQHHQLDTIRRLLPAENAVRDEFAELTWLEAYATTYRYPRTSGGLSKVPSQERLAEGIAGTRRLLQKLARYFDVDLDVASDRPAAHARPPRQGVL